MGHVEDGVAFLPQIQQKGLVRRQERVISTPSCLVRFETIGACSMTCALASGIALCVADAFLEFHRIPGVPRRALRRDVS